MGRVGDLIRASGLTNRAIGRRVGVSAMAVRTWRTGRQTPRWANVAPLAAAIGITAEQLSTAIEADRCDRENELARALLERLFPGRDQAA